VTSYSVQKPVKGKSGQGDQRQSGTFISCTKTTMSDSYLPREILDHIVDLLHDEQETLKQCCLVSKPWVPCTRNHLFATIEFISIQDLESWKKTFPDPLNSPACHTRTLCFRCPRIVTAVGGLIQTFSRAWHGWS